MAVDLNGIGFKFLPSSFQNSLKILSRLAEGKLGRVGTKVAKYM